MLLAYGAGTFFKRNYGAGQMVMGGIGGYLAGFMIYSLVLSHFKTTYGLCFIFEVLGTILGAVAAWRYDRTLIPLMTAFVGAYCMVRGLCLVTGWVFPHEVELYGRLNDHNLEALPRRTYIQLGLVILMTVVGFFTQRLLRPFMKTSSQREEDEGYQHML